MQGFMNNNLEKIVNPNYAYALQWHTGLVKLVDENWQNNTLIAFTASINSLRPSDEYMR